MDSSFAPYADLTKDDYSKDAPQISLELKSYMEDGTFLSLTPPYRILFTLRRSDTDARSTIFRWSQLNHFERCRFVLLHETPSGLRKVKIPELNVGKVSEAESEALLFHGHNSCIESLPAAGNVWQLGELIGNYQKALIPGEKYHFFWPGMEVDMWEWGTKAEYQCKELKARLAGSHRLPKLIIPASNILSFTTKQEDEQWPERAEWENGRGNSFALINEREAQWRREQHPPPSPPPLGRDARIPGTPILTMRL